MANWPTSLPQIPKLRTFQESREPKVVRTPTEIGPAKLRRRYTVDVAVFQIQLVMDETQLATFETFFESTIDHGSLSFTWAHPRTQVISTCRLRSVPSYSPQGRGQWFVSFGMEIVP